MVVIQVLLLFWSCAALAEVKKEAGPVRAATVWWV